MAISYKESGVDVHAGYKTVELMKESVKSTYDENVIGDLGSFGGFYSLENFNMKNPILVAGTDGVGTKLKYAIVSGKVDTVGIDCVAMCVNDVVCQGAKPLFFLDYVAVGKLNPQVVASIVKGVADGCKEAGCALIGGETAEMPGFYGHNEFDLAGFCTGIVDRNEIINGKTIKEGDILIGLESSGVHSNGFSLIRRLFGEDINELNKHNETLGTTLLEALMAPTKIYVKSVLSLNNQFNIKGLAHITGGGFIENIPRMIPEGLGIDIQVKSYPLSPLYKMIVEKSKLSNEELYNTFNMGIGMVMAVDANQAKEIVTQCEKLGEKAHIIGKVTNTPGVKLS